MNAKTQIEQKLSENTRTVRVITTQGSLLLAPSDFVPMLSVLEIHELRELWRHAQSTNEIVIRLAHFIAVLFVGGDIVITEINAREI